MPTSYPTPGFGRRVVPLLALALAGVLALCLKVWPQIPAMPLPAEVAALPRAAILALLLVNPLLLALLGAALGAVLAHRIGLRSLLAGTAPSGGGRVVWWTAAATGLGLALLITALDALWAPHLGAEWQALRQREAQAASLATLLSSVLYGGLTEEVMMRWGLMSLVAWGLWRLGGGRGTPARWVMALAMTVAALAFAAGHLPALASLLAPTPGLVARTLLLNTLAGMVFGWLYWRHHLEAAMLAHATTHLGFFGVALLLTR